MHDQPTAHVLPAATPAVADVVSDVFSALVHDAEPAATSEPTSPTPVEDQQLTDGSPNRHATAGRKGGERMRELIRLGRLYEQEHGLMIGRERLRQLVKFGRQYEADKGLAPKRTRVRRQSPRQSVRQLLQALVRIAKPSHRAELQRALAALDGHRPSPDTAALPRDANAAA